MRIRLPHPELAAITRRVASRVVSTHRVVIAGVEIPYAVFCSGAEAAWSPAYYDEEGRIFIADDLVALDQTYAELTVFHEHLEITYKRAGRSHAYAHRRAFVEELLAAREHLSSPSAFREHLHWRISGYPASKVPDPEPVIAQLEQILSQPRPRKGDLLAVIRAYRL